MSCVTGTAVACLHVHVYVYVIWLILCLICRANGNTKLFLTGAMCESPPVTCDTLMIYPSGDAEFCTEGQAKSSSQYVMLPGTFK